MKLLAMIPARMGSQRLPRKNLAILSGVPLIVHAIRKCRDSGLFDEVWVNSENRTFGDIANAEGVNFHQRPEALGNNSATSEQFVAEFLKEHPCEFVVQVHSIAPLLTRQDIAAFVDIVRSDAHDAVMSVVDENLECLFEGQPVNFSFAEKQNSQDLIPVRRIVWAITAWRRSCFLKTVAAGGCATYAGRIGLSSVGRMAGHVIKTQDDLDLAAMVWDSIHGTKHAQLP